MSRSDYLKPGERRRYDDEEERRRTIETKIGIILTVNKITITYLSTLEGISNWYAGLILVLAVVSAEVYVYKLRPREYSRPGVDIEEFPYEASREPYELDDEAIWDYHGAVVDNIEVNDKRLRNFRISFYTTLASLLPLLFGQMVISGLPIISEVEFIRNSTTI